MADLEIWLPALNAGLILVSGVFLVLGYAFIRRKQVRWHQRSMVTATVFAALFLVVYVSRAVLLPTRLFPGEGALRVAYFAVLVPHVIVAILVGPFVFVTLRRALGGRFEQHRRIALITFPMWVFTAISGWVVYWMLYHVA